MTPQRNRLWLVVSGMGVAAYPLAVYFGLAMVPPTALLLFGVAMIALRMALLRNAGEARVWLLAFGLAIAVLIALLFARPALAMKAYPICVSLAVALVFALSLRFPPTVIERIARLTEPALPPEGVAYTRRVTWVWLAFLLVNATISAATALWGTLGQWTLWNGLLSYLAIGMLFAGEYVVRCRVRRRHGVER